VDMVTHLGPSGGAGRYKELFRVAWGCSHDTTLLVKLSPQVRVINYIVFYNFSIRERFKSHLIVPVLITFLHSVWSWLLRVQRSPLSSVLRQVNMRIPGQPERPNRRW
jgi:hypothetical protein